MDIPLPADCFSIRRATRADNALLAEIGAETFFDSFAAENTPENMAAYLESSFSPEKQLHELSDPATRFLILEEQGETAAYARLHFGPAPRSVPGLAPLEIVRFYARKAWIGKGAGPRLMQACLDEARAAGCDAAWLDVWERNPRAIAFYRKWGFEIVGTQAFQLGEEAQTDYIMACTIS